MAENLKIASVNNPAADAENALAPVVQMPAAQKPKPDSDFPFSVTVGDVYEGPLDLLLDLIRKQDIDIYDTMSAAIRYSTSSSKLAKTLWKTTFFSRPSSFTSASRLSR